MLTHSSVLAWKIPWTEEPGRLQSVGSQRVGHNWLTEHIYIYDVCVYVCIYMYVIYKSSGQIFFTILKLNIK